MMDSHHKRSQGSNCLICFNLFNNDERRPRSLPCGHSFCSLCISDNLQTNTVACPSCRRIHLATSSKDFPINFALESILEEKCFGIEKERDDPDPAIDKSRCISKKLRTRRQEAITEVYVLCYESKEISSHFHQYNSHLEEGIAEHKAIVNQHNLIIEQSQNETKRVTESLLEEKERREKMKTAKEILSSAINTQDILFGLENVNLYCEDLNMWKQRTIRSFPKENLLAQSKEVQLLSKALFQRHFVYGRKEEEEESKKDEGEDWNGKYGSEEKEKEEEKDDKYEKKEQQKEVSEEFVSQSEDCVSVMTDGKKRDDGKTSIKDISEDLEASSDCSTIQEKILRALQVKSSWMIDRSIQTHMSASLQVQDLVNPSSNVRQILKSKRVFAIHEDQMRGIIFGRITMDENEMIYLHALGDPLPESIPTDAFILQFSDVMNLVNLSSPSVFLNLGIEEKGGSCSSIGGEGKGSFSPIGRIRIRLIDANQSNLSLNFCFLCTGEKGPTYVGSNIWDVRSKGEDGERIFMGDYEGKDGRGGKAVVQGVDWGKEGKKDIHRRESWVKGLVFGGNLDESKASLFIILTRDNPGWSGGVGGILGIVEEGLDILIDVISKYPNIKDVKIIDCGIIVSPLID